MARIADQELVLAWGKYNLSKMVWVGHLVQKQYKPAPG
jgi:hypothetical protein